MAKYFAESLGYTFYDMILKGLFHSRIDTTMCKKH